MHFDEVYHARTATEFLQDWRYGDEHDIYEWTHPHLAKYAMAGGIVAFGDDRVSATSDLGVPGPRRAGRAAPHGHRDRRPRRARGCGSRPTPGIRAYDLGSRAEVAAIRARPDGRPGPRSDGAASCSSATDDRASCTRSTSRQLDIGGCARPSSRSSVADLGVAGRPAWSSPRTGTTVAGDRRRPAARGRSRDRRGHARRRATGPAPMPPTSAPARPSSPSPPRSTTRPRSPAGSPSCSAATRRARGAARVPARSASRSRGLGNGERDGVDDAIDDGELPGIEIVPVEQVLVADGDGVAFLDRATGDELSAFPLEGGAHGLASVTGIDDAKFYATAGTADKPTYAVVALGQDAEDKGPSIANTHPLPGLGSRIGYDEPSARSTSSAGRRTGAARRSTSSSRTPTPSSPTRGCRSTPRRGPSTPPRGVPAATASRSSRSGPTGAVATVEIGQHAFGWRLPGVIAGALMAGLLYLLARILFRRREVARARRPVRARRRDALRPVADRDERRVRRALHRRRVHAVRRALDGRLEEPLGVLGRHAGHRPAARPRAGLEMGRRLRDRRRRSC